MEQSKRLFIDMDGTLAVFKKTDTLETLYEQGYFYALEPIANVVDAVKTIIKDNPSIEVHILSAVLSDSKYALAEKNAWLDRYLPEIDTDHRIFTVCGEDKKNAIPQGVRPTDFLLDDYTHNLNLWQPPARGIKLLNGINHTNGSWAHDCLRFDKTAEELARDIVSIVQEGEHIVDEKPMMDNPLSQISKLCNDILHQIDHEYLTNHKAVFDYDDALELLQATKSTIFYTMRFGRPSDLPEDVIWMERRFNPNEEFDPYVHENFEKQQGLVTSEKLSGIPKNIQIEGHTNRWNAIDEMEIEGKRYYLMENNTYGDDTACLIIDEDRKLICEDVYNGFEETEFVELFPRLAPKPPLTPFEEKAEYLRTRIEHEFFTFKDRIEDNYHPRFTTELEWRTKIASAVEDMLNKNELTENQLDGLLSDKNIVSNLTQNYDTGEFTSIKNSILYFADLRASQQIENLFDLPKNQGYYILDQNKEYAFAMSPTAPSPMVLWSRDRDGDYCNGSYRNTYAAYEDLSYTGLNMATIEIRLALTKVQFWQIMKEHGTLTSLDNSPFKAFENIGSFSSKPKLKLQQSPAFAQSNPEPGKFFKIPPKADYGIEY